MTILADIQARRSPTSPAWITWVRWICVLPVAIVASNLTESMILALLTGVLGLTSSSIVSSFCIGAVVVMAGSIVAPRRKVETALALIAFNVLVAVVALILIWIGLEVCWLKLRVPSDVAVSALAGIAWILGLLCGLHWIRQDVARSGARASG